MEQGNAVYLQSLGVPQTVTGYLVKGVYYGAKTTSTMLKQDERQLRYPIEEGIIEKPLLK